MQRYLFIGSNGHVCAIDPQSGAELWRTRLQKGLMTATHWEDVAVLVKDGIVFAGSQGYLFALEASSGRVLWQNELKGLGYNDVSLAVEGVSVQYLQKTVHNSSSGNS